MNEKKSIYIFYLIQINQWLVCTHDLSESVSLVQLWNMCNPNYFVDFCFVEHSCFCCVTCKETDAYAH